MILDVSCHEGCQQSAILLAQCTLLNEDLLDRP